MLASCKDGEVMLWQGLFLLFGMLFGFSTYAHDTHSAFRQEVIAYINHQTPSDAARLDAHWNKAYQIPHWSLVLERYCAGRKVAAGRAKGVLLSEVIASAVKNAVSPPCAQQAHWRVTFYYAPHQSYSFLDSGKRLIAENIVVQSVDKAALKKQIMDSRAYLMHVMHPTEYGFYKLYDVEHYRKQIQLRTIYTASSLYTLIKSMDCFASSRLAKTQRNIAQFLLNAQVKEGVHLGAFYYAYHPKKQKYIPLLVVGTASKTIFTLLLLNQTYPEDKRYLHAATLAGDWLVKQVKENGELITKWRYRNGAWVPHHKQSALYSGQVLSALSRLYGVTHTQRYLEAASKIKRHFDAQLDNNLLLKDDYRPANSISSSWALMSLMDYAKVTSGAHHDRQKIEKLAQFLVKRHNQTETDLYDYGRYWDAITPSGNGWINEVMGQVYHFCQANHFTSSCTVYRDAMIRTSRWLMQQAYTRENTFALKHPHHVIGGYRTGDKIPTIRTDAVCHGVNSMVDLYGMMRGKKGPLLVLNEQPFEEIVSRLRMG